jgi:hypothetical protein
VIRGRGEAVIGEAGIRAALAADAPEVTIWSVNERP